MFQCVGYLQIKVYQKKKIYIYTNEKVPKNEFSSWNVGGISRLTSRVSNNTRISKQVHEYDLKKSSNKIRRDKQFVFTVSSKRQSIDIISSLLLLLAARSDQCPFSRPPQLNLQPSWLPSSVQAQVLQLLPRRLPPNFKRWSSMRFRSRGSTNLETSSASTSKSSTVAISQKSIDPSAVWNNDLHDAPANFRTERIVALYWLRSAKIALSVPCCKLLVCTVS